MFIVINELNIKPFNFIYHFMGPSECFEYFITNTKKLTIIINNLFPENRRNTKREIIKSELEIIFDMLSWIFNKPIKNYKVFYGNKTTLVETPLSLEAKIFSKTPTESDYKILSARREILNESNLALRYIMHYRFLEVAATKNGYRGDVDKFILSLGINCRFIKDHRNPKKLSSFIKYIRNKIHATKNSYKFPYKDLIKNEKYLRRITKIVTLRLIK